MSRTIIAGSRTIYDYSIVTDAIRDSGYVITELICGMAAGVDSLGYRWAYVNKIPIHIYRPERDKFGKAAGHLRNFEMAANAEQAIIVWDGVSPGTKSMLEYAKKCQCAIYLVMVNVPSLVTQGRDASVTSQASAPSALLVTVASSRHLRGHRSTPPVHMTLSSEQL